jgi:16S rRNA (guanine1516-N2)-methyltransferase
VIATTGTDPSPHTREHAKALAARFSLPFVERRDASLAELRRQYGTDEILVVTAKGARLVTSTGQPFFFHPNNAAFRIKRLERGDTDIMLSVCQITPGDHVLDATLGLGADAIVFAHGVGETGRVVGVESVRLIAMLVEEGLRSWQTPSESLRNAMARVEVLNRHHLDYLRELPDRSFDVVYFDPMFSSTVQESSGIQGIRTLANAESVSVEAIHEALRVAKRRVVLKEGKGSQEYRRFGFSPYRIRQHQVVYSYRDTHGGE